MLTHFGLLQAPFLVNGGQLHLSGIGDPSGMGATFRVGLLLAPMGVL